MVGEERIIIITYVSDQVILGKTKRKIMLQKVDEVGKRYGMRVNSAKSKINKTSKNKTEPLNYQYMGGN